MPAVLRHNRPAIEERIARASAYLGIENGFDGFLAWVLELLGQLGIPAGLSAMGVDGTQADRIADMALVDPTAGGNPIPLTKETARSLFEASL